MKKAIKRVLVIVAILYFAIAAYGHCHQAPEEYVCPCDQCDCGPSLPAPTQEPQG